MKAIIIDDENNSRDIIALMLEKYCPEITIAGLATGCADGINKIKKHAPDLVFLDLEMPDGTGFEVFSTTLTDVPYETIFVTAFDKKFQDIIRFSNVELILKPVDKESLLQAVNTVKARIAAGGERERYQVLFENYQHHKHMHYKLYIPAITGKAYAVNITAINYLEAVAENCLFHLNTGEMIQTNQPFRYYADLLTHLPFYQINTQQMVQLSNISRLHTAANAVVLKSGTVLSISERRQKNLMQRLA